MIYSACSLIQVALAAHFALADDPGTPRFTVGASSGASPSLHLIALQFRTECARPEKSTQRSLKDVLRSTLWRFWEPSLLCKLLAVKHGLNGPRSSIAIVMPSTSFVSIHRIATAVVFRRGTDATARYHMPCFFGSSFADRVVQLHIQELLRAAGSWERPYVRCQCVSRAVEY